MSNNIDQNIAKQTAQKLDKAVDIIEKVIKHQYQEVHKALYENTSVEISGFAIFGIRPARLRKRLQKVQEMIDAYSKQLETDVPEARRTLLERYVRTLTEELAYLKTKQNAV